MKYHGNYCNLKDPNGTPSEFFLKYLLIMRVAPLLKMILIKRLLIPVMKSIYFYILIKTWDSNFPDCFHSEGRG
jgi:hypothetical protein